MSQENIFMHQVHDDAGAWSRAANRKKDRQAKREEREGQLERATSWKYFNEFMCLSNYGDKCLCINWQLAGWRSLSSLLSPTLFIPPRPSSLPALAEFMCWQAQATSQQQASKKKKKCGQDINKFADFDLDSHSSRTTANQDLRPTKWG